MEKCFTYLLCLFNLIRTNCDENVYRTRIAMKKSFDPNRAYISMGQSSYKKFVENSDIFVDTSLLIQTILEDEDSEVIIITYPRRFGKTINMDMVKTYLEIPVTEFGEVITPSSDASNYRLFVKGELDWVNDSAASRLKYPLLIGENKTLTKNHLGKYPVVRLNMADVNGYHYGAFMGSLREVVGDMFDEHKYMLEVYQSIISDDDKPEEIRQKAKENYRTFVKHLSKKQRTEEIQVSVAFLIEILAEHFKKKVYVLIDEYDAPFAELHLTGNPMKLEYKDELVSFLRFFVFRTLVNNNNTAKAIFTGIATLRGGSCLPRALKYSYYTFFDEPVNYFYGIEYKDIIELFSAIQLRDDLFYRAVVKYGSYSAGSYNQLKIFNPWSIAYFIDNRTTLGNYWLDNVTLDKNFQDFLRIESFRKTFDGMLYNESQFIHLEQPFGFTVEDFRLVEDFFNATAMNQSSLCNVTELAWKLSFMGGYVTLEKSCTENWFHMKIPNRELRPFMQRQIEFYILNNTDVNKQDAS